MFRANLDPGSPHVFMAITQGNGAAFQNRLFRMISVTIRASDGVQMPYWVRLTGNGNFYIGYISSDGVTGI